MKIYKKDIQKLLSEFIFYRTYPKIKDEKTGQMESWNDVVRRVVEGKKQNEDLQKRHSETVK